MDKIFESLERNFNAMYSKSHSSSVDRLPKKQQETKRKEKTEKSK